MRAGEVPTDEFWSLTRAKVTDAYRAKAVGHVVSLADFAAPIDAAFAVWDTKKPIAPAWRRAAGVPNEVVRFYILPGSSTKSWMRFSWLSLP